MCAWQIESRVGHHTAPTQRNARHSERAQLSGLDMRERGRDSAEHNLHLTSHQIGRRGSRAAVRGWLLASGGRAPRTNGPPDALSRAVALCAASDQKWKATCGSCISPIKTAKQPCLSAKAAMPRSKARAGCGSDAKGARPHTDRDGPADGVPPSPTHTLLPLVIIFPIVLPRSRVQLDRQAAQLESFLAGMQAFSRS